MLGEDQRPGRACIFDGLGGERLAKLAVHGVDASVLLSAWAALVEREHGTESVSQPKSERRQDMDAAFQGKA